MLKKNLFAGLLALALLASLAAPALAADSAAIGNPGVPSVNHSVSQEDTAVPMDDLLHVDINQVEVVNVINRDLHASYAVTGQNDRSAIVNALNAIEHQPGLREKGEAEDLRLLQIRLKDGGKREYWCHSDVLMSIDDRQIADASQLAALYAAMDRCEQNYPANIEWLGYMNPYRVTTMTILSGKKVSEPLAAGREAEYQSALSQSQREAILDLCAKLKAVKVGSVKRVSEDQSFALDGAGYALRLDFENGKAGYDVYVDAPEAGMLTVSVDNIPYDLIYTQNDDALFRALVNALNDAL